MLNRLHAMEIVTLTKMLGGWGQPVADCDRESAVTKKGEYSNLSDPQYRDSYKGTPGLRWKVITGKETAIGASGSVVSRIESEDFIPQTNQTVTAETGTETETVVSTDAPSVVPAVVPVEPNSSNIIANIATQPSLLSAWGAGGTWHEHNGSVFAPEEVFSPTVLSLLGYLNDSTATDGSNDVATTHVNIAAVTFAEWAKKGDANPIVYEYLDAQLVQHMRSTGAVFGRKFGPNSVSVSEWCRVMEDCGAKSGAQHTSSNRHNRSQDRSRNDYNGYNNSNRNLQYNNRRDNDGYNNNYTNTNRTYHDHDRHRDHRTGDYRSSNDRNYDNRNYRNDRFVNHGGRDDSDNKRRRY